MFQVLVLRRWCKVLGLDAVYYDSQRSHSTYKVVVLSIYCFIASFLFDALTCIFYSFRRSMKCLWGSIFVDS